MSFPLADAEDLLPPPPLLIFTSVPADGNWLNRDSEVAVAGIATVPVPSAGPPALCTSSSPVDTVVPPVQLLAPANASVQVPSFVGEPPTPLPYRRRQSCRHRWCSHCRSRRRGCAHRAPRRRRCLPASR